MKAKLAFYKAKNGDWVDRIIAWWTKSDYSHVELVADGLWYSTSPRDMILRKKRILANPDNWDYVEVDIDKMRLVNLFNRYEGSKYDWLGILGIWMWSIWDRVKLENKEKFFCSEWAATVMDMDEPWTYSPGGLYNEVSNVNR